MKNGLTWLLLVLVCGAGAARGQSTPEPVQAMIEDLGLREAAFAVREMPAWKRPGKILVRTVWPGMAAELQAVAPDAEIVGVTTRKAAVEAAGDAQVLIGFCDRKILARASKLHWVQVYRAGVEHCVEHPEMQTGDKLLTNAQRIASPALAETAIAMMMALVRHLDVYHRNQLRGEWVRDIGAEAADFMELEGRTALVVGLGGIGTQAAKRAHGLGMRVIAVRNSRRTGPDYVEYVGLSDELPELTPKADVVINTTPLTDETRGMYDAAFFDAMKPTAYFISVGRGESTVTADLVAALEAGSIAGAGLDVTDPEPLPEGHALWTMPRVLITPHTAGRSDGGRDRLRLLILENLRRYVAGDAMLSVVDIERGY